jgi:hypothetical protein
LLQLIYLPYTHEHKDKIIEFIEQIYKSQIPEIEEDEEEENQKPEISF